MYFSAAIKAVLASYGKQNAEDFEKPGFSPISPLFNRETGFLTDKVGFSTDKVSLSVIRWVGHSKKWVVRRKSRFLTDKVGFSTDNVGSSVVSVRSLLFRRRSQLYR